MQILNFCKYSEKFEHGRIFGVNCEKFRLWMKIWDSVYGFSSVAENLRLVVWIFVYG